MCNGHYILYSRTDNHLLLSFKRKVTFILGESWRGTLCIIRKLAVNYDIVKCENKYYEKKGSKYVLLLNILKWSIKLRPW